MSGRTSRRVSLAYAGVLAFLLLNTGCFFLPGESTVKYILYPARSGDTLQGISKRFDVAVEKLERVNKMKASRTLSAGQTIRVPYHGQSLKKGPDDLSAAGGAAIKRPEPQASSLRRVKLSRAARYVGKLKWPVGGGGGYVSSVFGWRWLSFHEGIDISAEEGLPVMASHDGKVVYSGSGIQGYGNLVVIKGDGILSVYAHNSRNRVRAGSEVRRGDQIADVGMTGKSTGPHLHFETRIKDQSGRNAAVDPLVFLQNK